MYVVQRIRRAASTGAARSLPKNPKVKPTTLGRARNVCVSTSLLLYITYVTAYVYMYTYIYIHIYVSCITCERPVIALVSLPSAWLQPWLRQAERKTSRLRVVIKRKRKTRALCKKLDNLKKEEKKIIERNVFARVPRKYETRDSRKNLPYILYNLSQLL